MFDSAGLEILDAHECFALLGSVNLGRIVFTERALPAVQPVVYAMQGHQVVIKTGEGSKLTAAANHAVVAFEADVIGPKLDHGWSVSAVGHADVVIDRDELAVLHELPLEPWADGASQHFIRIRIEIIQGRRLPISEVGRKESR